MGARLAPSSWWTARRVTMRPSAEAQTRAAVGLAGGVLFVATVAHDA